FCIGWACGRNDCQGRALITPETVFSFFLRWYPSPRPRHAPPWLRGVFLFLVPLAPLEYQRGRTSGRQGVSPPTELSAPLARFYLANCEVPILRKEPEGGLPVSSSR